MGLVCVIVGTLALIGAVSWYLLSRVPTRGWTVTLEGAEFKALAGLERIRRKGETVHGALDRILAELAAAKNVLAALNEPTLYSSARDRPMVFADDAGDEADDAKTTLFTAPQPKPKASDGAALWPKIIAELEEQDAAVVGGDPLIRMVIADMRARHVFGMEKYGVPLTADNGRDHLADAYQEYLDGAVYSRAEIERCRADGDDTTIRGARLREMYRRTIDLVMDARRLLAERSGQ